MIKLFLLSITFVIYSYSQELPILVNEEFSSSENAFLKEVTADTYNAKILNGRRDPYAAASNFAFLLHVAAPTRAVWTPRSICRECA